MRRMVLILFVVCSLENAVSQEFELIRHQVQMGETVKMLSTRYRVEPSEIYRLNKFAIEGISQGMTLQILVDPQYAPKRKVAKVKDEKVPAKSEEIAIDNGVPPETEIKHKVAPKETLISLSKKYNVPVEEIRKRNEKILAKGLKAGQVLTITTAN